MEKIKIGKIVNAVALRGEVKVYAYSDRKERYEELKEIAQRSGLSVNAVILILVDTGLSVIDLGMTELRRFHAHSSQHTDEQYTQSNC